MFILLNSVLQRNDLKIRVVFEYAHIDKVVLNILCKIKLTVVFFVLIVIRRLRVCKLHYHKYERWILNNKIVYTTRVLLSCE